MLEGRAWAGHLLNYPEITLRHLYRAAVRVEPRVALKNGLGEDLKSLFKRELLYVSGFFLSFLGVCLFVCFRKKPTLITFEVKTIQPDLFIILQSVTDLTRKSFVSRNAYCLRWRDILQGSSLGPSSMSIII